MDQLAEYRMRQQERWQMHQQQFAVEPNSLRRCGSDWSAARADAADSEQGDPPAESLNCSVGGSSSSNSSTCTSGVGAAPKLGRAASVPTRRGSSGIRAVSAVRAARLASEGSGSSLPGAAWPGHQSSLPAEPAEAASTPVNQATPQQVLEKASPSPEQGMRHNEHTRPPRPPRVPNSVDTNVHASQVSCGLPSPPAQPRGSTSAFVRTARGVSCRASGRDATSVGPRGSRGHAAPSNITFGHGVLCN